MHSSIPAVAVADRTITEAPSSSPLISAISYFFCHLSSALDLHAAAVSPPLPSSSAAVAAHRNPGIPGDPLEERSQGISSITVKLQINI
ncbi:hypothetical protein Cni_G14109 [Canna indica]|uniref:Uncharacterized protein n=1 Tax=Canna indica TaxID=4628 RepID=A0AAQ3KH47_9LILI|nr:hypothetical protein Cni_G14109 [Canna indica]